MKLTNTLRTDVKTILVSHQNYANGAGHGGDVINPRTKEPEVSSEFQASLIYIVSNQGTS